jgi:hypothetical protein
MKSIRIKGMAAACAVGIAVMVPAGAAFAKSAGKPARADESAGATGAKANEGHGSGRSGAGHGGRIPVEIGDALKIEKPEAAEAATAAASCTTTSGGNDSKCDGSPSGNGNGNGQAVGKPAAGSVGNADDKAPKGQSPDGSDRNRGYECDSDHGVGRTNPAHTGCSSSPAPPPNHGHEPGHKPGKACPPGHMKHDVNGDGAINEADCTKPTGGKPTDSVPTGNVAVPVPVRVLPSAQVLGETVSRPAAAAPQAVTVAARNVGTLPFTGGNSTNLALAGLALILAGEAARRWSRRPRT